MKRVTKTTEYTVDLKTIDALIKEHLYERYGDAGIRTSEIKYDIATSTVGFGQTQSRLVGVVCTRTEVGSE